MKRVLIWFLTAIIDQIVRLIDVYEKVELIWESKSREKRKNLRNNFQKIVLILAIIGVKLYDNNLYTAYVRGSDGVRVNLQQKVDDCTQAEIDRLKEENSSLEKFKSDLIKSQAQVDLLKEQLKKAK